MGRRVIHSVPPCNARTSREPSPADRFHAVDHWQDFWGDIFFEKWLAPPRQPELHAGLQAERRFRCLWSGLRLTSNDPAH